MRKNSGKNVYFEVDSEDGIRYTPGIYHFLFRLICPYYISGGKHEVTSSCGDVIMNQWSNVCSLYSHFMITFSFDRRTIRRIIWRSLSINKLINLEPERYVLFLKSQFQDIEMKAKIKHTRNHAKSPACSFQIAKLVTSQIQYRMHYQRVVSSGGC